MLTSCQLKQNPISRNVTDHIGSEIININTQISREAMLAKKSIYIIIYSKRTVIMEFRNIRIYVCHLTFVISEPIISGLVERD